MTPDEILDGLREIMGYVENGTQEPVQLHQDDATKDYSVSVGYGAPYGSMKREYTASSFLEALEIAITEERAKSIA